MIRNKIVRLVFILGDIVFGDVAMSRCRRCRDVGPFLTSGLYLYTIAR